MNDHLKFLDVLIKKKGDKFLTTVCRKPTVTGQYLNFQSYCNKRRKTGLIKTLFNRICSPELFSEETNIIKHMLQKNGYPRTLVDRILTSEFKCLDNNERHIGPENTSITICWN